MGLRGAIGGDLRRGAVLALFGCALVLPVDYLATVIAYPGDASAGALLRLPLLDATLLALAWVPLALLLGGVGALARLAVAGERRESWPGLFTAGGGDRARVTLRCRGCWPG